MKTTEEQKQFWREHATEASLAHGVIIQLLDDLDESEDRFKVQLAIANFFRAELTSAREALKKSASRTYDSTTKIFEPNAAAQWLDEHPEEAKK